MEESYEYKNIDDYSCRERTIDFFEHKLADELSTYPYFILGKLTYLSQHYLLDNPNYTLLSECNEDTNPNNSWDNNDPDGCIITFYKVSLKDLPTHIITQLNLHMKSSKSPKQSEGKKFPKRRKTKKQKRTKKYKKQKRTKK